MLIMKCVRCGAEFRSAPSAKAKYCSRACSAAAQRRPKQAPAIRPAAEPAPRSKSTAAKVKPVNKGGRPRTRVWPERTCKACGKVYQSRNGSYCSVSCRVNHAKIPLPALAPLIKPLLGTLSYRQIAERIAKETGKPCHISQVGRAAGRLAVDAERERCDALRAEALKPSPMPAEVAETAATINRRPWVTQAGVAVTLAATSRPEVTKAEVRLAEAAWAGFARGLELPPEKRKRKARLKLVPSDGREV